MTSQGASERPRRCHAAVSENRPVPKNHTASRKVSVIVPLRGRTTRSEADEHGRQRVERAPRLRPPRRLGGDRLDPRDDPVSINIQPTNSVIVTDATMGTRIATAPPSSARTL